MPHENRRAKASTPGLPALSPRPTSQVLAPARLEFQWERVPGLQSEIIPVLLEEKQEFGGGVPWDPDWKRYFEYDSAGLLRVWTARSPSGTLVGYVSCILAPSLASRTVLYGYGEHYYLRKEWREGWTGFKMLKACEKALVNLGARVVRFETNDLFQPGKDGHSRLGAFFKRAGYFSAATTWEKRFL